MEANEPRIGVWLVGAFGTLATTAVVGCRAIARGFAGEVGLVSAEAEFSGLSLASLGALVFGGHDLRRGSYEASAKEISAANGSIRAQWIEELRADLVEASSRVRAGVSIGAGTAIESLHDGFAPSKPEASARAAVTRLQADLREFMESCGLERLVVINVASTEPPAPPSPPYESLAAFERSLDADPPGSIRPSALYAYAALRSKAAYVNFAASNAPLCPAIEELAREVARPYMGSDGKTGETLVKSGLAPMFRARNLRVASWVGYNILGNRDGLVLSQDENRRSKVECKDSVLPGIFGYPLKRHVGIDYVESVGDNKVAWDFIHFRGFLEVPMSMQFTWHGCDSILAAPLVLDLARFSELALRRQESGPMLQLSSFFKNPLHGQEHDLYRQFAQLREYAAMRTATRSRLRT